MSYIAYLNTQYPSLSHTFIEREIRWVREAGIDVQPMSIRRPGASGTIGEANQHAAAETVYILHGVGRLLASLLLAIVTRPVALARLIVASQRLSPPGIKARLKHLAYSWEALRLAREMHMRGLDHVHVHMANNAASVALLASIYDRQITYSLSIHGSAEFFEVTECRLKLKTEGAVFVRCISDFCRGQIMTWTDPTAWDRFHVVHCGVDPEVLTYSGPASAKCDLTENNKAAKRKRAESRQMNEDTDPLAGASWLRDNEPTCLHLITIGRIVSIKGYDVLLDACAQCTSSGVNWQLTMIGDGPQLHHLKHRAQQSGIANRITFTGPVSQDDLPSYLEQSDIMVVPSFMEGVPTVLMEAMAKGLPVIATNVAGVAELVEHGKSGWVIRAASVEHLAAAITEAWQSRDKWVDMGLAGREMVCQEFEVRQMGRIMGELFEQYLDPTQPLAAKRSKKIEPIMANAAP